MALHVLAARNNQNNDCDTKTKGNALHQKTIRVAPSNFDTEVALTRIPGIKTFI